MDTEWLVIYWDKLRGKKLANDTVSTDNREKFIEDILSKMTLDQKVGQCFTIHWGGSMITPYLVEAIEKLHIGGLRVSPFGQNSRRGKHYHQDLSYDYNYPEGYEPIKENLFIPGVTHYISPEQYAKRVNKLQKLAMNRGNVGIPLHISTDQEGDTSREFCYGGIQMFPSAMGLTATGDLDLTYKVCNAVGKQLTAMGVTNIHSPVVDINLNPNNPEISFRAYSDDPQVVADYALASMRGFQDAGLSATAKHFPGRGDSDADAHAEITYLNVDWKRLTEVELYPYKVLIENGLESIMMAHMALPLVDPTEQLASVSRDIVTGLLREKLGFEGVVTTDSITMGALMKRYGVGKACAVAIWAGCDLALNKTESEFRDQAFCELKRFVEEGLIREEQLDQSVKRLLRMKYDKGMFDRDGQVDAERASDPIRDKEIIKIAAESAEKCAVVMRDEENLLPLSPDETILLIEQKVNAGYSGDDVFCHDKMVCEAMFEQSMNIIAMDTEFKYTAEDEEWVMGQIDKVDKIVVTNFYWRDNPYNNTRLIRKLLAKGKKVIVITNCPYDLGATPEAKTIICNFSQTRESIRVAAEIIYGKRKGEGQWPLKKYSMPKKSVPLSEDFQDDEGENTITVPLF